MYLHESIEMEILSIAPLLSNVKKEESPAQSGSSRVRSWMESQGRGGGLSSTGAGIKKEKKEKRDLDENLEHKALATYILKI